MAAVDKSWVMVNNVPYEAIESLYLSSEQDDVHFTFKLSDDRIPVHKIILASCSPVFRAEFFGLLPEKDEVKIEDDGISRLMVSCIWVTNINVTNV